MHSRARDGMANGTGAHISMTARPWDRPPTMNARSTRLPNRGACCQVQRGAARAERAMAALDSRLIRRDDGLALLFTPPFDHTPLDPGYIKGYPPGIRENGGQYTHAAMWSVLAYAQMGDGDRAAELFATAQSGQSQPHAQRGGAATRSNLMWSPPTCIRSRRTSGVADGRGIRARRDGCIAPASKVCLASASTAMNCRFDPCVPRAWPGFTAVFRHGAARLRYRREQSAWRQPRREQYGRGRQGARSRAALGATVDDGERHSVTVTLGVDIAPWSGASSGEPASQART